MRMLARAALGTVFALTATTLASAAPPPPKLALTGARIIPVVGPTIDRGTVLIEHGIITAVGAEVAIPYDALEIELDGKVLFPGMIDPHSARGLDVTNENIPVAPFLDVYDAIDPSRLFFEDSLRDGITTVHVVQGENCVIGGLSRVVRPIGRTIASMTVEPALGLKICVSPMRGSDRMLQRATLRDAFLELDYYLERLAETRYEQSLSDKGQKLTVGPAEARRLGKPLLTDADYDDAHRNLVRLREGRLRAWVYCGAATDVQPAIDLARTQGFLDRTVFVLAGDAYRAVRELAAAKRPVVLAADLVDRWEDQITGELREVFIPRVIADAGLVFALQPHPDSSLAERYLNYQAARLVREGIPRETALAAITIDAARTLGLESRLGSLEVGKVANVLVLTGDPLDFTTWVDRSYIDGVLAYDRARDPRLQELFGGERGGASAGEGGQAPAPESGGAPVAPAPKRDGGEGDRAGAP
ncbi:MAG: amidohydrolase family protein [Planctomycetota bacterium]